MNVFRTTTGREFALADRLGGGGQGEVFQISAFPEFVLKRFFPRTLENDSTLEDRIRVMVDNAPMDWREPRSDHPTLSWPVDSVEESGQFVGFLMPLLNLSRAVELHQVANPSSRRSPSQAESWIQGFSWRYAVAAAANLALATNRLHDASVVIGDFNERNILVWADARVTLLDCDSMQVTDRACGTTYLCRVGRPDFTAPELIGEDWATTLREPSGDLYALAIHIHQLLLEGTHPFDGVWRGAGKSRSVTNSPRMVGGSIRAIPTSPHVLVRLDSLRFHPLFARFFTAPSWMERVTQS